jgi:hypothetical protein
MLICTALWTLLRGSFNAYVRSSLCSSDLPGGNPTTLNGMILYYRLMTKWSGLGDSTELSRVGLSHIAMSWTHARLTLSLSLCVCVCVCVLCVCRGSLLSDSKFVSIVCQTRMVSTRDIGIRLVRASEE